MRRVSINWHMHVRPQLLAGLAALVIAAWGAYMTAAVPVSSQVVVLDSKPQVAAAFIVTPPPPHATVDCGRQACLVLTFDDGPSAEVTPIILDTLARHKVHATFFVIGSRVAGNEGLLRRMYQEGHEIGNHSWSHPRLSVIPLDQAREQVNSTQAAIAGAGVPAPTLLRPPYGDTSPMLEANIPMTIALWNADPADWDRKKPEDIPPLVKAQVKPGRVVVLHDNHRPTADALDALLTDLQKDYQLVTFSELFNLTPGQPGRYYGR